MMCNGKPCGSCGGAAPPHPGQPWPGRAAGGALDGLPSFVQGPDVALRVGLPFLAETATPVLRAPARTAPPAQAPAVAAALGVLGAPIPVEPTPTLREAYPERFTPAESWGGNNGRPWYVAGKRPPAHASPDQRASSAGELSAAQQGAPVQHGARIDVARTVDTKTSAEAHALPTVAHANAVRHGLVAAGGLAALLVLL